MKPIKVTSDLLSVVLYTVFQGFLFHVERTMYLLFIGVLQTIRYVFSYVSGLLVTFLNIPKYSVDKNILEKQLLFFVED